MVHIFTHSQRQDDLELTQHSPFGFVFRVMDALQAVVMMLCISYELIFNATANSQLFQEE